MSQVFASGVPSGANATNVRAAESAIPHARLWSHNDQRWRVAFVLTTSLSRPLDPAIRCVSIETVLCFMAASPPATRCYSTTHTQQHTQQTFILPATYSGVRHFTGRVGRSEWHTQKFRPGEYTHSRTQKRERPRVADEFGTPLTPNESRARLGPLPPDSYMGVNADRSLPTGYDGWEMLRISCSSSCKSSPVTGSTCPPERPHNDE